MYFSVFASAFGAVFIAEIAGDKTLYSVGALGARYRAAYVLAGVAPACAAKMLVAVLLAQALRELATPTLSWISAGTFVLSALIVFRDREHHTKDDRPVGGIASAFMAIFFTEWGDPGQLAAAAWAARTAAPSAVWAGATSAMLLKAVGALWLGARLARTVPQRTVRLVAVGTLLSMALAAVVLREH